MTESMPTEVEFSLFAQGIDAIKSKNPQFRFNPDIVADLKSGTVYRFLIANDYFNNALIYFLSCEYIQNNVTIRAELPDQSLCGDYFVLSLMGIAAQAFSSYLNATRYPRDWIKVVTKNEKKPAIAACDYLLEEVINARLVALPLADYMTLERLLIVMQKMLRNEEHSEHPERISGVPYIWKRELVCNLSELYGKEYGDPISGVIMNLAKIYIGESHQSALEKWVKDGRKRFQTIKNLNVIASKENKIHDKYYR